MKKIPLSKGYYAEVDDADFEVISGYSWYARVSASTVYAQTTSKSRKTVIMHRLIIGALDGVVVDHKDGNGLNNQRSNLRICTKSQNAMNRQRGYGTSQFLGVSQHRVNSWRASIVIDGKQRAKYFKTEMEAVAWRDEQARKQYGEFARINLH